MAERMVRAAPTSRAREPWASTRRFKDPLDEASTLAVFVTRERSRTRRTRSRYGTLDDDARRRADAAPNQKTVGKRIARVSVPRGGGAGAGGRVVVDAHEIETEVGGGTAGRFGAAVELTPSLGSGRRPSGACAPRRANPRGRAFAARFVAPSTASSSRDAARM